MYEVNLVAVAVVAIFAMVVGMAWYSPALFGKTWMKAVGFSESDMQNKKGMWKYMLGGFVTQIVLLYTLGYIFSQVAADAALMVALFVTIVVGAIGFGAVLWERKPASYFLINLGYNAIVIVGGGAILLNWPW